MKIVLRSSVVTTAIALMLPNIVLAGYNGSQEIKWSQEINAPQLDQNLARKLIGDHEGLLREGTIGFYTETADNWDTIYLNCACVSGSAAATGFGGGIGGAIGGPSVVGAGIGAALGAVVGEQLHQHLHETPERYNPDTYPGSPGQGAPMGPPDTGNQS